MEANENGEFTMMRVKTSTHRLIKKLNAKHVEAFNKAVPLYETIDFAVKTAKIKKAC